MLARTVLLSLCVSVAFAADETPKPPAGPAIAPLPPGVSLRAATVRVVVVPDHRDWTYALGEPARFTVTVTADNEPIEDVTITYTLGPDMFPGEKRTVPLPLSGMTLDAGTMKEPGFLRCIVSTDVAGHHYRGLATAAFAPDKITATQVEPADFDAFWAAAKADLAKVPMDATMTLLPESCTSSVNVYHVSFRVGAAGWSNISPRIYGILCEPVAPGRYPAILKVPGAGVRPYFGDANLASKGAIVLEIGIHGIPVNLAKEVYDELGAGALNGYQFFNFDDRDKYYYKRVYMGCIRANDFLTSRPAWDGKNLVVMGASQGGQLTIVTAALDPRVTGLSATHPAFCDVTAELHGRAGGWPHPFMPKDGVPNPLTTPARVATSAYYDSVNFAKRIRVPGYYNWGYNDETCPPTAAFAAYNLVTAPKTLGVTLEMGHAYTQEQGDAIVGWVTHFLGIP